MKDEAIELKEEALEVREGAASARSALESRLVETLVDTFALMNSQATVTKLYIQAIRSTLNTVRDRMDVLEEKLGKLEVQGNSKREETLIEDLENLMNTKMAALQANFSEQKNDLMDSLVNQTISSGKQKMALDELTTALDNQKTALEEQKTAFGVQTAKTSSMAQEVSETLATALTLEKRQQTWISEVRLISLYKVSGQTNPHPHYGHESESISDGQFTFSRHHWSDMATYSHTTGNPNNRVWLKLGGLFRIHKIKIWNVRHCCLERIVGSKILADNKLVGTISQVQSSYDFTIADNDPTYATEVTLHQPRTNYLHILELQVWGSGPFSTEDKFA